MQGFTKWQKAIIITASIILGVLICICAVNDRIGSLKTEDLKLKGYTYIGDVTAAHIEPGTSGGPLIKTSPSNPYTWVILEEMDCPLYQKNDERYIMWKGGLCEVFYDDTFSNEGFHAMANTHGRGYVWLRAFPGD